MSSISSFTFGRFCRTTFETFWKPMSPMPPSPPMAQAFGSSATSLVGHEGVGEVGQVEVLGGVVSGPSSREEGVGEPLGDHRAAGVVHG